LLGILPVNMIAFAHVFAAYSNPSLVAGFEGLDLIVWAVTQFVFEGKMITLFSILFGAGLFLQVTRSEARLGRVGSARWLYFRRLLWLFVFGMLHAYFLWYGDVLAYYAVIGFLVYALRRLRPRWLLVIAAVLFCAGSLILGSVVLLVRDPAVHRKIERGYSPTAEAMRKEEQQVRGDSFLHLAARRAGQTLGMQIQLLLFFGLWRITALMLLGVALVKLDVLTARRSVEVYLALVVAGFAVGVPLTGVSTMEAAQPFNLQRYFVDFATSEYFGTLVQALGYLGGVMAMVKLNWLPAAQRCLAAVGRMALTNYVSQSLICCFIFNGWGLAQFGLWSRSQQALLVLSIWVFQLVFSALWLRNFRFGPMEWLWRTLTYLRFQPFRRNS